MRCYTLYVSIRKANKKTHMNCVVLALFLSESNSVKIQLKLQHLSFLQYHKYMYLEIL